jgi:hypothetical protein
MTRWQTFAEYSSFGNGKGQFSFNKLVTFTALWCFVVAVLGTVFYLHQQPTIAMWSFGFGVVGAGFGLKGYLRASERRMDTFNQTDTTQHIVTTDVAKVVEALRSRDESAGYQPSGKVPRVHDD